jgi:hypothetical protein
MYHPLAIVFALAVIAYVGLQVILHATQNEREPNLLESKVPFFDSAIGILQHRANYLTNLRFVTEPCSLLATTDSRYRSRHHASIHTLRMPFQRLYVVQTPHFIQAIQSKANAATFIPNLLDFGMLFSGLNADSQTKLRSAFGLKGNGFTMSVHKYLLSGESLKAATRTAVDRLSASLPNSLAVNDEKKLLESMRHELTIAMTGAIYGPENPYDDPKVETSWWYVFTAT